MYKLSLFLFACLVFFKAYPQNSKGYQFHINLQHVLNDKVSVELKTPPVNKKEIRYYMPKVIPGYYTDSDFGRFIEDFQALDRKGKPLPVTREDLNTWKIYDAKNLYRITYSVNDTYDDADTGRAIFEPCGSNIKKDTTFFINNHCFLGYLEDMKQLPYRLQVRHSPNMFGTTAMDDQDASNGGDLFVAESYNRIVDNPILYAAPDTATVMVGDCKVLIGLYAPSGKVSAAYLADYCGKLMQAQAKYLGGKLPVKKYAFLIYLSETNGMTGASGALEHSYSSAYFTPEDEPANIAQFLRDNAAHEFFHILTPLNIHSEEIHYFDFIHPKMSQHLWLYEGTTEYHSLSVQEKYGFVTKDQFLTNIGQLITTSRRFFNDTLPFTVMSAGVLHDYATQFGNVYQKGALIGMCIDIKLRQLSKGKYGIINIIHDLAKKYGRNKPFKDGELFKEIGRLTYPEIEAFLKIYVAGSKPLPLKEMLGAAGVLLQDVVETRDSVFNLGSGPFTYNQQNDRWVLNGSLGLNAFGKKLGIRPGDEIVSLNGTEINGQNFGTVAQPLYKNAKEGDILTLVVNRAKTGGGTEQVTLSAPMMKVPVMKYNQVSFMPNPTPAQLALQKSWLEP